MSTAMPRLSRTEVDSFLREVFPQLGTAYAIGEVTAAHVEVILTPTEAHLRPGGTVSGPTLFALADYAMYVAVLARIGRVPLAVTTNASIDFMRKPEAGVPLVARAKLQKLGRQLAVGLVEITNQGRSDVLAQSTMTYAIPPDAAAGKT